MVLCVASGSEGALAVLVRRGGDPLLLMLLLVHTHTHTQSFLFSGSSSPFFPPLLFLSGLAVGKRRIGSSDSQIEGGGGREGGRASTQRERGGLPPHSFSLIHVSEHHLFFSPRPPVFVAFCKRITRKKTQLFLDTHTQEKVSAVLLFTGDDDSGKKKWRYRHTLIRGEGGGAKCTPAHAPQFPE